MVHVDSDAHASSHGTKRKRGDLSNVEDATEATRSKDPAAIVELPQDTNTAMTDEERFNIRIAELEKKHERELAERDNVIATLTHHSISNVMRHPEPFKISTVGLGGASKNSSHLNANLPSDPSNLDCGDYFSKLEESQVLRPSGLAAIVPGPQDIFGHGFEVSSEADYTSIVRMALTDALSLLPRSDAGDINDYSIHAERSIFSLRPDLVVVRRKDFRNAVLAIENKKDQQGNILDKEELLGQVYDYAMVQAATGREAPIVVLSTVDKTALFWRDEDHHDALASLNSKLAETPSIATYSKRNHKHANALESGNSQLSVDPTTASAPLNDKGLFTPKSQPCPREKSNPPPQLVDDLSCEEIEVISDKEQPRATNEVAFVSNGEGRKLRRSQVFQSNKLIQVLHLALSSVTSKQDTRKPQVSFGSDR